MATFKPTSTSTKKKTFTPTKYAGYNTSTLRGYEYENKSALDILNEYQNKINRGEWISTEDREKYKAAVDSYTSSGNALRSASKFYGTKYSDEEEKGWQDYLASLSGNYNSINDFYNQFENETIFDYFASPYKADFKENSAYVSTQYGKPELNIWGDSYSDTGFSDIEYDYINKNPVAEGVKWTNSQAAGPNLSGPSNSQNHSMTDDEIAIFNYLYKTKGKEAAYEYTNYLKDELNARQRQETEKMWADFAAEDPVKASLFSVFISPLQSTAYISQAADFLKNGTIDQNANYNKVLHVNTAIRDQVSKDVEHNWGAVGSFAYQTGMGMGDFLLNTAITGGNQALSLALMGTSAAANTVMSAKDRGLNDTQAFTLGTIAGAAEIAMEKIGLDALFDKALLGKDALTYVLKNALAEGGEEFGSSVINLLADVIVSGDKSQWQTAINQNIANGDDETTAWWKAVGEQALSLGADFLGGAVSGGIMGSGGAFVNATGNAINGAALKNEYGLNVGNLAYQALSLDNTNSFAQQMQNKVAKGQELSNYQVGRLAQQIENNNYEAKVKEANTTIKNRLLDLGETLWLDDVANAITKQALGEELSTFEKTVLKQSQHGSEVVKEVKNGLLFSDSNTTETATAQTQKGVPTVNSTPENATATEAKTSASGEHISPTIVTKNAEGKTVKSEISGIEVDGDKATFTLANGEKVSADKATFQTDTQKLVADIAVEKVSRVEGFSTEAATAMVKGYDGSVSPSEYVTTFEEAFKLGRDNAQIKELTRLATDSGVTGRALLHAYDAGLQSRNVALEATNPENSVLQNGNESAIINTESEIIQDEGKTATESISLRRGGERINGAYSEGQIPSVEGSTGQTASRGEARRIADSKAVSLYNTGREVRVADLGILNGSKQQKVRVIDNEADYTPSMKQAAADAKKHGLTAKFYVGDNILIEEANGSISGVRGYILGNTILVRADHEVYTSDQIARHEAGHDMIAKGQVNVKAVKKKLIEVVGKENVELATESYAAAYDGSGLTTDEIWEELICDSLGDINIFGRAKGLREHFESFKTEVQSAVKATKTEAKTTEGVTEGKASRNFSTKGKVAKYLPDSKVGKDNREYLYHQLLRIYSGINDGIADGIAIANGKTVFIVDSGKDNGKLDFGVRRMRNVSADIGREKFIRSENDKARSNGNISDELLERLGYGRSSDSGRNMRRESGSELQADTRKSDNQQGRVSGEDADQRGIGKASRELDTEYLSAVTRGDMETAQRMVDEAAKKAGYTVRGLHATNAEFNAFDISKTSAENFHGKGIYFTNSVRDLENNYENYEGPDPWQKIEGRAYELAYDKYGISYEDTLTSDSEVIDKLNECYDIAIEEFKKTGRRITAYLRFDNPLILEKGMQIPDDYSGYDGIIDKQVYENIGHSGMDENTVHYVVLNPTNIKSADPVTYDDNGNVIPLSERFNPEEKDIRYSRELDLIDYINENEVDDDLAKEYSKADKSMIDRLHLINALESITDYPSERGILSDYRAMVETIAELEKRIASIDADIKVLSKNAKVNAEAIKTLKAERKMLEMRVHKADEKVLKLESTKALRGVVESEREKAYRKAKQEGREALLTQRAKSDAKLDAVKDYYRGKLAERRAAANAKLDATVKRYQEARAKGIEGRHKTAERHAIKALKDKFIKMMDHPTDRQYIPANLISAMVDVCQMIDTDTDLYKADGSINKAQQARNEQMERLLKLRDEYAALGKNPDPMYSGEFDQDILDYLDELRQDYTGKSLNEMTLVELKEFRHILRAIDETLQDARKLIGWGEADSVYDAGDRIISDQRAITEKRKGKGEKTAISMVIDNSISPLRNVKRMADYKADSPLVKSFRDLELGVRKKNKFAMDAYKSFETLTSGENAKKFEDAIYKPFGKEYVDKEGRKFRVSKMQMMQAIMSYNRELANDKLKHVSEGGFTFADLDLLNKGNLKEAIDPKNAHSVSFGAVMAVEFQAELANDQWAQDYMNTAEQFFDGTAKDAINEANMTLKHRIIATGSKYIPYEVNKDFVVREITSENDIQQTISGYGMMKDLKDGATQPLIITGLNNILERHIDQVSNIHGLAVPVRNFNKVWNVKAQDGSTTVQEAIKRNFGDRGAKVMIQAVKDVQGSRIKPEWERVYSRIKSNVIGATFMGNGSVVAKQVGSLFTATAKMKWRDPVSMIGNLLYTMANYKKISAEVDKYTASAWMRRQGMSDAELHSLTTEAKKKGVVRLVSKLPTAINPTKWISGMDSMVALSLWKYAKADVAKQTGLSGEDLNKAAAEYYDDIIENTQSMSDALHRPEIQKSGGVISETLGTFKTDLYQGAGLMADALGEYRANPTKESANALAKAVTGNVMSALWGSIMTTAFALLRYKVNRYRDDEDDEIDAESWLKVQGSDLAGDLVGYIVPLFGGEVYDIVSAVIKGEQIESFDNMVLEAINDLVNACVGVGNAVRQGDWANETAYKKLINSIGSIFGVPISNMTRLWEAINLHAQDIANGEFMSFEAGLTSPNNTRLYRAYIEGDADKINKASRLYKDEAALKSGLRKGLRENDPRVKEAALAKLNGDDATYKRLCEEVIAEGKFDRTIIIDAFAAEYNYHNTKKKEAEAEGKTYP